MKKDADFYGKIVREVLKDNSIIIVIGDGSKQLPLSDKDLGFMFH